MTGAFLLVTPARSPAIAAVNLLAVLAAVVVAFALFLGLCAIAGCMVSSRVSRSEELRSLRCGQITLEPDPLESPPPSIPTPSRDVRVWIHHEGHLPLPFNPVGEADHSMRIRE
jgi:hypothetical protein